MLTFLNLKQDLYRLCGVTTGTVRADIKEAVRLAILQGQQLFCLYGDWGFLDKFQDLIQIPLAVPYETGTVTATQDSKTVAGSGTAWTSAMVGRYFRLANKEFYEIKSVESTISLTLAIPFQDTTAAAATYEIRRKYYDLPLNFQRCLGRHAKLSMPGYASEWAMGCDELIASYNFADEGRPTQFALVGNQRGADYYNTSTVTIATSGTTSTWTLASGTLPTDIVDREVQIAGEDRSYRIATRATAATFTTYETYVNPSDATGTQSTASSYAITPSYTQQIAIYPTNADDRYILSLPYIKKLPELLKDADVSSISLAGYDEALLAVCRAQVAGDGRTAMRADLVQALIAKAQASLDRAWGTEVQGNILKLQDEQVHIRRRAGPSWIG